MNPIVIKIKQSQCQDEVNKDEEEQDNKQYLMFLGGISF